MMIAVDAGLNLCKAESGFGGLHLCRRHAHEAFWQRSGDNRTRESACYKVATVEPLCNQITDCSSGAVVDDHMLVVISPFLRRATHRRPACHGDGGSPDFELSLWSGVGRVYRATMSEVGQSRQFWSVRAESAF